ncbi:hypothetical protein O3P69_014059 [Scylla paramamosain]|uniref:Uncharacterized protein n=1 Tax=Scylla paramamosain TaxID=85552 RepID=A0AAW0ST17_SCYPA
MLLDKEMQGRSVFPRQGLLVSSIVEAEKRQLLKTPTTPACPTSRLSTRPLCDLDVYLCLAPTHRAFCDALIMHTVPEG